MFNIVVIWYLGGFVILRPLFKTISCTIKKPQKYFFFANQPLKVETVFQKGGLSACPDVHLCRIGPNSALIS